MRCVKALPAGHVIVFGGEVGRFVSLRGAREDVFAGYNAWSALSTFFIFFEERVFRMNRWMRRIGFLFLWIGFLLIVNVQLMFQLRPGLRQMVDRQDAEIDAFRGAFDAETNRKFVIATAIDCYDHLPNVIWGGMLMLTGGLALAYAPRRRGVGSHPAGLPPY